MTEEKKYSINVVYDTPSRERQGRMTEHRQSERYSAATKSHGGP